VCDVRAPTIKRTAIRKTQQLRILKIILRPAHHLKVIIAANPLVLEETKNIKDHFLGRRARRGRNKIWSPSPSKGAKLARERSIDSTAVALMTVSGS
jgi:hypothetical protein